MTRYLLIAPMLLLYACPQSPMDMAPEDKAQWLASAGAEAVDRVDVAASREYTAKSDKCRESHDDWSGYDECMEAVDRLERAVAEARQTLRAMQDALDMSAQGKRGDWMGVAGCVSDSVSRLVAAVRRYGWEPPAPLRKVVKVAESLSGGCSAPLRTSGGES